jgi:hypothetical protein
MEWKDWSTPLETQNSFHPGWKIEIGLTGMRSWGY